MQLLFNVELIKFYEFRIYQHTETDRIIVMKFGVTLLFSYGHWSVNVSKRMSRLQTQHLLSWS